MSSLPRIFNLTGLACVVFITSLVRAQKAPGAITAVENSIGMKFVRLSAGEFTMGSPLAEKGRRPDEGRRQARIERDFFIGQFEVTHGQFRQFVEATGYKTDAERGIRGGYGYDEATNKLTGPDHRYSWRFTGFAQTDEHPVVNVSWNDANAFCRWLGEREKQTCRLPTEAEWEYACRGGTTTAYANGDDAQKVIELGNIMDALAHERFTDRITVAGRDGFIFTAPVGSFRANGYGLHDMHGNVWEWTADDFGPAHPQDKVVRGGDWYHDWSFARSAQRFPIYPGLCRRHAGFRVVRDIHPQQGDEFVPAHADEPVAKQFSLARAAAALDVSALAWKNDQQCIQCHANMMHLIARPALAHVTPMPRDTRDLLEWLVGERWKQKGLRYPAEAVVEAVPLAFDDARTHTLHPLTRKALDKMVSLQREDGSWQWVFGAPKAFVREFELTMFAALGIIVAPEGYATEEKPKLALERIRKWTKANPPKTAYAKGMLLWASTWLKSLLPEADRQKAAEELFSLQSDDGGWAIENLIVGCKSFEDVQFSKTRASDGYGTGFAIFAARNAGIAASDARIQRGIAWLKANQRESGRWFVSSLNKRADNVISNSGTAFAVLALAACGETKGPDAARFVKTWGKEGEAPGEFNIPIGIAINAADEIFITDHYNSRVQKFDANGRLLAHFPVLPNPGGITADGDLLYITHFPVARLSKDKTPDRVSVYSQQGEFMREWGSTGTDDGQLDFPGGIAINKAGEIFVADQTNRRVQVFDREGKFLRKWGEYGVKPGQFGGNTNPKSRVGGPQFIAIGKDGSIFTTEASVGRVQKFDPAGKPLLGWGTLDDRPGGFGGKFTAFKAGLIGPIGICFDHQDRLWISTVSGRVQCFSTDGTYIGGIGETQGTGEGQFYAPHGVAINSRNELFVVDTYNHRVQKFVILAK